jgi:murein L,D-transpeptidase YafK
LNYPNAADRILSDRGQPGGDIFIHGSNVSIGCLAMGNEAIEEIYLVAVDSRAKPVHVHIFPAQMNSADWPAWRDEQTKDKPALATLWEQLQVGFERFESEQRVPVMRVEKDGRYVLEKGR